MTILARLLTVMMLCTALSLSAWSYPTLFGDTGLVLAPSADTMPYTFFQLGIDYAKLTHPTGDAVVYPIRLTYGIADNIEIFGIFAESSGENPIATDVRGGGVKVSLLTERVYQPAPGLAAGVRAAQYRQVLGGDLDVVEAYLAASKILFARQDCISQGFFIRAHAGVSYTNYSGAHEDSFISPFGGLSYVTAGGNSLVVDFVAEQENVREATVSGAARVRLSDTFWLQLATTRPLGIGDQSYSIGLMYQFGDPQVMPRGRQIFYY